MPASRVTKLELHVLADAGAAARQAAAFIAKLARQTVGKHGRFVLAVSGGQTPRLMFEKLVTEDMPWARIHLAQVDERVAPAGDSDRNLTSLRESLLAHVPLPSQHIHVMPVEADDLQTASQHYAEDLRRFAGLPPMFDLVHLGLGDDGHTASLIPGDPVLAVQDQDIAVTAAYRGYRRMTMTCPIINRARHILWLVTGEAKAEMLRRLVQGDTGIPAGRINRQRAMVLADKAASALLVS